MTFVFLLAGLALGFCVAWFYMKSRAAAAPSDASEALRLELGIVKTQHQALEKEGAALRAELGEERRLAQTSAQELASAEATLNAERKSFQELRHQLQVQIGELTSALNEAETSAQNFRSELADTAATLRAEQEKYRSLSQDTESVHQQIQTVFENAANKILEEKTEKFTSVNREHLDAVLKPLHEKIKDFHERIDTVYTAEARERNTLRGEILQLVELNKQISQEAHNLTRALKGDTKQQGNWGELILEKVLEYSGLRKDLEYKLQESFSSEDGRQFPDVVVYLPDERHLIIDSKVSLIAFDRYIAAESEAERSEALKQHIASVRNHIKGLSEKNYQSISALRQPDFILLFMPIESSFGLAVQADAELFAYAWDRKIVIVSPSTLLATLRTISSIWKQERQTKNALEIAKKAGSMYEKFVGFVEDIETIGKKIDDAKKGYEGAVNKLSTGKGNLIRQAEQLRDLGIKTDKTLQKSSAGPLLDRADLGLE